MGLGSAVRTRLGRWEVPASDLYRSLFINLDDLVASLASLGPATRILEIGCGDGAMAERLCAAFPDASYVGIDISPTPGRLFGGDRSRAAFRTLTSTELVAEKGPQFDLVVVIDVVHHVQEELRSAVLLDAGALVAPGGLVAIKEWERGRGVPHLMAYTADRYVSGDATVRFMSDAEIRGLVEANLADLSLVCEGRIPPHRNNLLLALRKDR